MCFVPVPSACRNMQSRIVPQQPSHVLLLDADTQTEHNNVTVIRQQQVSYEKVSSDLSSLHISLTARINELELQNAELQESVDEIRDILCEFKRMWENKTTQEKQTDVLLRNIGVIS